MTWMQDTMFGAPEPVENLSAKARVRDDAPVAAERQLLWPADLAELMGPDLLERLYGRINRRTRLRMDEVCREIRCDSEHVRRLILSGSLDATDIRHPNATERAYRIYRYSVVRWLFNRDFMDTDSPRCNLPDEDLQTIENTIETLIKNRRKRRTP